MRTAWPPRRSRSWQRSKSPWSPPQSRAVSASVFAFTVTLPGLETGAALVAIHSRPSIAGGWARRVAAKAPAAWTMAGGCGGRAAIERAAIRICALDRTARSGLQERCGVLRVDNLIVVGQRGRRRRIEQVRQRVVRRCLQVPFQRLDVFRLDDQRELEILRHHLLVAGQPVCDPASEAEADVSELRGGPADGLERRGALLVGEIRL